VSDKPDAEKAAFRPQENMMTTQLHARLAELDLTGRSFLTIHDFSPEEVLALLELGAAMKDAQRRRAAHPVLDRRAVAMIFMKSSTRTRVSFEIGIEQLGAQPLFLSADDIQLRVGETIKDTAHVMSRYVDAIMIRTFAQQDVEDLARYGQIPIINGLTDDHHPCQGMADALTVREHCGELAGKRLVYSGDGNNVAHSLAEVGAKTGMHIVICTPEDYRPDMGIIERAQDDAKATGATIALTSDLQAAVEGADVIYTDTFTSMGQEAEHDVRLAALEAYQVNMDLVRRAGPQVKVMHCLPAHWGEEITEEVLYSSHSVVFDQAENRLHAQKAIMAAIIG
jgi:ornithine carbamoyltransferase